MSAHELFQAIGQGDRERVIFLLDSGVDPNACDDGGDSALAYALAVCNGDIAATLLDRGADVNGGEVGLTPLQMAFEAAECEMAERLIGSGANPNRRGKSEEGVALHVLAKGYRNTHFYALLIQAGADVNARDDGGNTPLMTLLAEIGIEPEDELGPIRDLVQFLILNGADPSIANDEGTTSVALVQSAIDDEPLPVLLELRQLLQEV